MALVSFAAIYDRTVNRLARHGLERIVNGTDWILISPKFRGIPEECERDVWRALRVRVESGRHLNGRRSIRRFVRFSDRSFLSSRLYAFEPDATVVSRLKETISN